MKGETSSQSGRRRDKDVRGGGWRRQRRDDAGRGASGERREGGGRFIWSFIRGSEAEERETGRRTKAIRGFFRRRHVRPKINKSSLSQHPADTIAAAAAAATNTHIPELQVRNKAAVWDVSYC